MQHFKYTFTFDVVILLPGISPTDIFIKVSKDYVHGCCAELLTIKTRNLHVTKGLVKSTMVHPYDGIPRRC